MTFFNDRKKVEILIIIIFIIAMLFVKSGQLWDHKIMHDYPISFRANDNFFHSMAPESIKDEISYQNFAN
ncbi:MAG: hypothetical protein KAS04_00920 [Candidatus Aenigmarchaeota archaeon]|nr:hypothetical protein [Candidatus Aenigmarchaeota archaeon]